VSFWLMVMEMVSSDDAASVIVAASPGRHGFSNT
jgi:hypothetical protein